MGIIIRKAKKNDLKKIVNLFVNEYGKAPYFEKWKFAVAEKKIKKYLKNDRVIYVAVINEELIGFVIFSKVIWDDGEHLMIDEIVVDSTNQGKGIGKKLMKFAEEYFKEVTSVDLWTFKLAKAYKFYKKLGYKNHEKGVMMYKKLK